jgi:hypothetical protein
MSLPIRQIILVVILVAAVLAIYYSAKTSESSEVIPVAINSAHCLSFTYNIERLDNISTFNYNTCTAIQEDKNMTVEQFSKHTSCADGCDMCQVGTDKDIYCTGLECVEKTKGGICTRIHVGGA